MNFKPSLIAVSIALAFFQSAACAQEAERTLAPVKTTASQDNDIQSRTELGRLTEATPMSGAVVDREELEHLQLVNNLLELGKRVPGISMVRNMRIPDGGKQYTENRIDGMRTIALNTSVLDELDPANIDHVEIITGPGSALYGSGSLGGTISVFTRQPPKEMLGRLSQEAGSWGFQRSMGNFGTSTEDGRFGFILSGSTMDNDGWRRSNAVANQNAAAEHKDGLALKTLFRPTDSTKITLGVDQAQYDYRWAGTLRMSKFEQDWQQVESGTYGRSIDDYKTQSIKLQQMLGDRAEVSVAYAHRTDDGLNYGGAGSGGANNVICDDGSAGPGLAAGKTVKCSAVNAGSRTVTNTLKKALASADTTTVMLRREFDFAKSTIYLGVEQTEITNDSATYNNSFNALQGQAGSWGVGTLNSAGSLTKERNSTPFYHLEFSPLEKLRFHVGQRFDKITYDVNDRTVANKDSNKTYNGDVWKTGVTYDLAPNQILWGNWSESMNAPASSTLVNNVSNGVTTLAADLKPEASETYEIGLRGTLANRGVHYDLALYHTSNKGFIVARDCSLAERAALNGGNACRINENAGQLTAKGFESMASWAAAEWLDVGITYTYAEAYYNKYKTTTFDYSGNSYQAMPRNRINLRLAFKPAPKWMVELEGDHYSKYFVNSENTGTYARPDLFSLRASYRSKDWSFWFHAINLTNEKYATRVGYSTIAGVSQLAASAGQGNAGSYTPLTLRAGISYSF
jgi:outer membrane receptor protein involved in Fe transport